MPANPLVQARIDAEIKKETAAILQAIGLTVSDAVRLMLTRVAREKALPFEPFVPKKATLAAILEAREGNRKSFDSVEALMSDLHTVD